MAGFTLSRGKTALITGGASGIGLALAKKCTQNGMSVVLVDRNASLLNDARKKLGDGASTFEMDVLKEEDWARLRETMSAELNRGPDLLFLNAGISKPSGWKESSAFSAIMAVNYFGVVHGITAFLDDVKSKPGSAIVITGSKQGITNPPGNPAYNASKAAVKAIAEHLSYDLRGSQTSVHLLVPGFTFTGIGGMSRHFTSGKPAAAWTPEQVVDYLEGGLGRGEFYILCPDNEVTEEMDKKRMAWTAQDLIERRPPLSRWREEYKEEFNKFSSS